MKIFDLLIPEYSKDVTGKMDFPDYFYDNSLLEATLLDLLHYALYETTALLIDLRTSLYFDQGNTLVIVFRGVKEFFLNDNFNQHHVWTLGDSSFTKTKGGVEFFLPFSARKLKIHAQKLDVYIGNAKNIGDIGASIPDGIAGYLQTTPHWDTEFEVVAASKWG